MATQPTLGGFSLDNTELYDTAGANPGAPTLSDIHQAEIGDCYFLSALGAVVEEDPDAISQKIHDNGDGTYTVTFGVDYVGTNKGPSVDYCSN